MKKLFLGVAAVALTVAAQAQETRTETRTEYTGKDQVISISPSCSTARETAYSSDLFSQLSSEFSMTRCRQKKTFQVNVESTGKWYRWSKEVTAIPGTESYEYEVVTETKSATQSFGDEGWDFMDRVNVQNQCRELRRAYADQVIDMAQSNCVNSAGME